MADYAEMYKTLFQAMTQVIGILQEAQRATEETYISSEPTPITMIKSSLEQVNKPNISVIADDEAK